jgi:hypothetical protein
VCLSGASMPLRGTSKAILGVLLNASAMPLNTEFENYSLH